MWRKSIGLVALVSVGALFAADPKDTKDKDKKEGKTAKITKIDLDKKVLSVTTEDKKKMDLMITDDVQFIGPKGGVSKEGLKDDRVTVGAEVTLIFSDAAGKKLKEVHLPVREKEPEKDKPKDKPKDK